MIFDIFRQGSSMQILASVIACVAAILLALSLHEFAHAFAAVKNGDDTPKLAGRLSLNPFVHLDYFGTVLLLLVGFGYAKPVPVNSGNFKSYKKGMFSVSIAGVLTNFILAFFSALVLLVVDRFVTGGNFFAVLLNAFFFYFTLYNIALCVFNLIPVYPLDGFNLMLTFSKNKARLISFSQKYGIYLMFAVFLLGGYFVSFATIEICNLLIKFWSLIFGGLL